MNYIKKHKFNGDKQHCDSDIKLSIYDQQTNGSEKSPCFQKF